MPSTNYTRGGEEKQHVEEGEILASIYNLASHHKSFYKGINTILQAFNTGITLQWA